MEFVLVGQPNCGKSSVFNEIAGYKSVSANFPGVSVKYTKSSIDYYGSKIEVVDLPGVYSPRAVDEAEKVTVEYVRNAPRDSVFINVIDASVLGRSLPLTFQLLMLGKPVVIALNMIDEARKKGISVDARKLSDELGVPVVETIARKGKGISQLVSEAFLAYKSSQKPPRPVLSPKIEPVIDKLKALLAASGFPLKFNYSFIAYKILERDELLKDYILGSLAAEDQKKIDEEIYRFEDENNADSSELIEKARHERSVELFNKCAEVSPHIKRDIRGRLDDLLMHPVAGFFFMAVILYLAFYTIYSFGQLVEPLFLGMFEQTVIYLKEVFNEGSLQYSLFYGLFEGIGGGIGIVIPYLLPFFIILAILEDTGYLARIAYLIDSMMHKIGLHGLSVVPLILGYGCTVPGILATRILKSPRDKFITSTLTTLVPCSARMTIIFGLVGFFISIKAAVIIYVLNFLIIGVTGKLLSKALPEVSPGLILEIPRYHLPDLKGLFIKTWYRLKEFIVVAWPLLIIGSVILELINYLDLTDGINSFMAPFTSGLLGLPPVLGITLLFGIMRKELALILLFTAIGTHDVLSVLSFGQTLSFTIFVTFYVPCLATFAALAKELDYKKASFISFLTAGIAVVLAVAVKYAAPLFT